MKKYQNQSLFMEEDRLTKESRRIASMAKSYHKDKVIRKGRSYLVMCKYIYYCTAYDSPLTDDAFDSLEQLIQSLTSQDDTAPEWAEGYHEHFVQYLDKNSFEYQHYHPLIEGMES